MSIPILGFIKKNNNNNNYNNGGKKTQDKKVYKVFKNKNQVLFFARPLHSYN